MCCSITAVIVLVHVTVLVPSYDIYFTKGPLGRLERRNAVILMNNNFL